MHFFAVQFGLGGKKLARKYIEKSTVFSTYIYYECFIKSQHIGT